MVSSLMLFGYFLLFLCLDDVCGCGFLSLRGGTFGIG